MGLVGAGGVLISSDGNIAANFSGGLKIASNNQAKLYALYLGETLLQEIQIRKFIILGDSLLFIQQMITKASNMELSMHKIHHNLEGIKDVKFYQVKRSKNRIANDKYNMVCVFGLGVLVKNGDPL